MWITKGKLNDVLNIGDFSDVTIVSDVNHRSVIRLSEALNEISSFQ